MPAFIARATTGVSGEASKGEIRMRSTFWVMKLSICEVWVFTFAWPSAIWSVNCGTFGRGRSQLFVDVSPVGLGVRGLRKPDDELSVLAAFLDQRRRSCRPAASATAAIAPNDIRSIIILL